MRNFTDTLPQTVPPERNSGVNEDTLLLLLEAAKKSIIEGSQSKSFNEIAEYVLRHTGIEPLYVSEESPGFLEMRKKLSTMGGLIISNHPNWIEIPLILKTLNRKDLKILVHPLLYNQIAFLFPEGSLISAEPTVSTLRSSLQEAQEHIQGGGALLIFPTGGNEQRLGRTDFQSGLRHLLGSMSKGSMIYSFSVDSGVITPVEQQEMLGNIINHKIPDGRKKIVVREACDSAGNWQDAIASLKPGKAQNDVLRNLYTSQFQKI